MEWLSHHGSLQQPGTSIITIWYTHNILQPCFLIVQFSTFPCLFWTNHLFSGKKHRKHISPKGPARRVLRPLRLPGQTEKFWSEVYQLRWTKGRDRRGARACDERSAKWECQSNDRLVSWRSIVSKAHLGRLFHSLRTTFWDVDFNLQG